MSEEDNCERSMVSEIRKLYEDATSDTSSSTMEEPEKVNSPRSYLVHLTSTGPIEFKGITPIDTNIELDDWVYSTVPSLRRPNVFSGTMDDTQMNSVQRTDAWSLLDTDPVRPLPLEVPAPKIKDIGTQVSEMDTQPTHPVLQKDHTVFFKELEKVLSSCLAPIRDELTNIRAQYSRSSSILQNKGSRNDLNPFIDSSQSQKQDEGVQRDESDDIYESDDVDEDLEAAAVVKARDPVTGTDSSVPLLFEDTFKTMTEAAKDPPLNWATLGSRQLLQLHDSAEICFALATQFKVKLEEIPQNSTYCEGQFLLGLLQDWDQLPVRARERILYRVKKLYEYLCFHYGSLVRPQCSHRK